MLGVRNEDSAMIRKAIIVVMSVGSIDKGLDDEVRPRAGASGRPTSLYHNEN